MKNKERPSGVFCFSEAVLLDTGVRESSLEVGFEPPTSELRGLTTKPPCPSIPN